MERGTETASNDARGPEQRFASRREFLKGGMGLLGVLALPSVVLVACGSTSPAKGQAAAAAGATAASKGEVTVRIAASRGIVSAPVWNVGRHASKYGFSTKMSVLFTYADQQRAVQNKQTDLATSGITNPASIADQGAGDLRVIAGQVFGGQNLILRKGVQASTWKDLEGKKIGLVPGTYARILFLVAAQEHGVDLSTIQSSNVSNPATALQALQKGDLDGFVLFSPTTDQAVVQGIGYYPPHLDIGNCSLGPANSIILANTGFLANSTLATNFARAYVDSVHEMQQESAFVKVATQLAGIPAAVAQEAFKNLYFSEVIDEKAIAAAAKLGPKYGFAKTDTSAKVGALVDYSLLEAATGKARSALSGTPAAALQMVRS